MKLLTQRGLMRMVVWWLPALAMISPLALRVAIASDESQTSAPARHADQSFALVSLGDGWFEGIHGTFKQYRGSDEEKVWVILLHCASDSDAKRVYDARIRKSTKVIREVPVSKESVHMVVLNAVASDVQDPRVLTEIVIRIGSQVRDVQSRSASDALTLAAELRNP